MRNAAQQLRQALGLSEGHAMLGTIVGIGTVTGTVRVAMAGGERLIADSRAWRTGQQVVVDTDGRIIGPAPGVGMVFLVD